MPPGLSLVGYAFQFVAIFSHGERCFKVSYLFSLIWNSSTWSHCTALALIHQSVSWENTVPLQYTAPIQLVLEVCWLEFLKSVKYLDGMVMCYFSFSFHGSSFPWSALAFIFVFIFYFVNYLWRKCQLSSEKVWWNTQVLDICLTCRLHPPFF